MKKFSESLNDIIKLPDILTLAAMKAFALGRRAKWKDYKVSKYSVMNLMRKFSGLNWPILKTLIIQKK